MTRFDFFLLSRSTIEIKRRSEMLLRLIVKEYEDSKRETNDTMNSAHDSEATNSRPQAIKKRRRTSQMADAKTDGKHDAENGLKKKKVQQEKSSA